MVTRSIDNTSLAARYAYAVDIRRIDTGVALGVALVVPSSRYLSVLAEGAGMASAPELSDDTWREIAAWAADGNARLPAKPAPMNSSIVEACLGEQGQPSALSDSRPSQSPMNLVRHWRGCRTECFQRC